MTGQRQHFVPQMMIKRFAGGDGKLVELSKPTLSLKRRRKSPKGILFHDDFYRDSLYDFDADVLTPIEQKFARIYPSIADATKPESLSGFDAVTLIDWIASMLVRTRVHICISQAVAEHDAGFSALTWSLDPSFMSNIAREHWFHEFRDLLARPKIRWKIKTYPDNDVVVLTDHPVCQTNGLAQGGQVTVVPLSKHRVLFGGHEDAIERCDVSSEVLNAFLAGWAERSIFAAINEPLRLIIHNLGSNGNFVSPEWCTNARRPFFGINERLGDREIPPGLNVSNWWNAVKDSYGQSLIPR